MLHSMTFPAARLPWVPAINSNRGYYHLLFDNLKIKYQQDPTMIHQSVRFMQILRMNSAAISHYLPKRY
jgi:hypothetical protein